MLSAVSSATAARAAASPLFLERLDALMAGLRAESRNDATRIEAAYGGWAATALRDRGALRAAWTAGRVAPLPPHAPLLNIRPRLDGPHPIGERDRAHQPLYVAADPATLGCLLHVAARVRSAPLEVTSLVRHEVYQRALRRVNPNAVTDLPMHALGLAFDISVLNVPLRTTRELRDVLRAMRDEGDLFFVAERRQYVFHVVPAPERLPFYRALFEGIASLPVPPPELLAERNLLAEAAIDRGWIAAEGAQPRGWFLTAVGGLHAVMSR